MRFRKAIALTSITALALLSACDSDKKSSTETSTTAPAPGENPTEAITMDGLAGNWNQACTALADSAGFSTAQLSVADNVATLTESFYSDSGCATAASPAVVVTDHSLEFDGTFSNTSLGNANNVESTVESKTVDGTSVTDGVNEITHDIMLITNNTLYFGNKAGANNGTTEALRPDTLEQTLTWSNL